MEREKSKKRVFVSFNEETEWAAYEITFNIGTKLLKPVKFQANRIWRTRGAPDAFAGFRASFASKAEALLSLKGALSDYQGNVHEESTSLIKRLESHHGFSST